MIAIFLFWAASVQAVNYTEVKYNSDSGLATQTLTKDKSPYLLLGQCPGYIGAGNRHNDLNGYNEIVIEAGVVVKFAPPKKCGDVMVPTGLNIMGYLELNGTKADPIIFTSFYDDTAGGDSDGAPSVGNPGDWGSIIFTFDDWETVLMNNVVVRYGGNGKPSEIIMTKIVEGPMLGPQKPTPDTAYLLNNWEISDSASDGLNTIVPLAIHNSSFHGNAGAAINSYPYPEVFGPVEVDATNNWWGDESGPTVATNPEGKGEKINGQVWYDPWIKKIAVKAPVILIPGILGTEMKQGGELIWMNPAKMAFDINDDFLDVLKMKIDGTPNDPGVVVSDILRAKKVLEFGYDYADGLIKEFITQGYTEEKNLFIFPYDWRLDIKTNAILLKQKIDAVLAQTNTSKVNIVAHSMGGLVTKQYILNNPEAKIDKLVFLGTPHLGAPKALKALLFGDTFGIPLILDQEKMKELGQNMDSIYQLLPSAEYVNKEGGYFYDLIEKKIYNFAETNDFLAAQGANNVMIQNAIGFHSPSMDNFDASGIDTYNISGCKRATVGKIIKRNKESFGSEYYVQMVAGDGTVPLNSSDAITVDHNYYFTKAHHGKMPSQDILREAVVSILDNNFLNTPLPTEFITAKDSCKINGKLISVHSPVDIHVYNSAGAHVGIDQYGNIEEGVEGVAYEEIDHNKFVFLPDVADELYTVQLRANGAGLFSMRVADIEENETKSTAYFHDIPVVPSGKGEISINAESVDDTLIWDALGNGQLAALSASAVLDSWQANDFTKPTTTIFLSGTAGTNGWYKSTVKVSLTAGDDNSGVLQTEYSLDNGAKWSIYDQPFVVNVNGTTTIQYRSVDMAGNQEEINTKEIKIDNTPPEANIVFDTKKKIIAVTAEDNFPTVKITVKFNSVLLSDNAGNTTEIFLQKKIGQIELTSIRYNGVVLADATKNKFKYSWVLDTKGNFARFIQIIYNPQISALYGSLTNVTKFSGTEVLLGKAPKEKPGMVLLKIKTNKGYLSYSL